MERQLQHNIFAVEKNPECILSVGDRNSLIGRQMERGGYEKKRIAPVVDKCPISTDMSQNHLKMKTTIVHLLMTVAPLSRPLSSLVQESGVDQTRIQLPSTEWNGTFIKKSFCQSLCFRAQLVYAEFFFNRAFLKRRPNDDSVI